MKPINVFVHVAYGYSAENWGARWRSGALIGVNEPFAYGYARAEKHGCHVTYSTDHTEGRLAKLVRYALRFVLGFDFIHAWRNRRAIFSADAVWTHTESQSLAVAALLRLHKNRKRPKTILQSVWLIDRWPKTSIIHRWLYRYLLSTADVLTFHSSSNTDLARKIFPGNRVEQVYFGINADYLIDRQQTPAHTPIRVLSVGNDAHRDWPTLRDALTDVEAVEFRIVTTRLPESYLSGNGRVTRVASNEDLFALYAWADIAVVPLKSNLHASGITVVQEATILGLPVVCTDVGGLTGYFPGNEVRYVPVADPEGLREAIGDLAADLERRSVMVEKAQDRVRNGALNSESFVLRHVEISRELVG